MLRFVGLCVLSFLFFSVLALAQVSPNIADSGVNRSGKNPLQIALLHWYNANLTTTIPVGPNPQGAAFDGANIWTASWSDNTVTKVRANDCTVLGSFSVGAKAFSLAFDGANIWVTTGGNQVTKLRASDGTVLGTFTVGVSPAGIAFDGANMWVSAGDGTVTKLRAADGKLMGKFTIGGSAVFGVAFDGANIWVANYASSSLSKF